MKRKFSDFSQLSAKMFKTTQPDEPPEPIARSGESHDEEVLAYFACSGQNTSTKPAPTVAKDDAEVLLSRLRTVEADCARAKQDQVAAEAKCREVEAHLAKAEKALQRLQGECNRLNGELEKVSLAKEVRVPVRDSGEPSMSSSETSQGELLSKPRHFDEAFPGEMREMLIATLIEGLDAAQKGSRERRASVLSAVLEANRSNGELERRRAKLRQILKDCGERTDPYAFEQVGMKLISGRNHWKLQYADVRMPISKTPSDHRASRNAAADMANRCF